MKILFLLLSLFPLLSSATNIVLIGDTGKDNDGQRNVATSLERVCAEEGCELGILAGDNVYPVGVSSPEDPILERVFDNYYNILNIPFLVALGNHDYGKYTRDWERGSFQLLHALKNPLFVLPHYWYTHETEEAVIAVIDTTRLMWGRDVNLQAEMVKVAFEKAQSLNKWFLVVGHHPYLSNGRHGNAGRYEGISFPYFVSGKHVKLFLDRHVCGKAHFYLSGHDHSLQLLDGVHKKCDSKLLVSGTGATATKVSDRNPAIFQSLELGFFHLTLSQKELKLRAFNHKSELLYEGDYKR